MKYPTNELYLSKNERHGLYFMLGCMSLIIFTIFLVNNYTLQEQYEFEDVELIAFTEFVKESYSQNSVEAENKVKQKKNAFIFDPNTTPLDSLLLLPIPNFVAKRIDKYRNKGGKFKSADDLAKIYGIEKHFSKIAEFVNIQKHEKSKESVIEQSGKTKQYPTQDVPSNKFEKATALDSFAKKTNISFNIAATDSLQEYTEHKDFDDNEELIMEINEANEYQLQMINGIGPYFSKKIVEFRSEVGGFYTLEQLRDIGMRDENFDKVVSHLTCNPGLIRQRNINYTRQDSLGMIPGISYQKAKIAVLYINNHFPIEGPEDLKKIKIFKADEIELMLKYLKFTND